MTDHMDVVDKWTGETLASLPTATPVDIDEALARAERALQQPWPPRARSETFRRLLASIDEATDLCDAMVGETGFVPGDVAGEIDRAKVTVELCAEESLRLSGETVDVASSAGFEERLAVTIRVPRGIVLAITPFNTPFNGVLHKVGPALAAGNAVLLKPHEATPLSATRAVALLHEAGVPPERLQVLHGDGESVALPLLRDPGVAFTSFTGSTRVGTVVKRETGHRPVALELGSIASTILCADADLERAATEITRAGYRKAGQVCTSVQRVFVADEVADELTASLTERVATLRAGDPRATGTNLGPLIGTAAAERVERLVADTVTAGAKVATGGGRDGSLVEPTLLLDVDEHHPFAQHEAFGPVVGITRTASLDEAIQRANRSPYGLQAGVFTSSISTALQVAKELAAGGIIVNGTSSTRADGMPFGGQKASGFGKEGPRYAIREMTVERLVLLSP